MPILVAGVLCGDPEEIPRRVAPGEVGRPRWSDRDHAGPARGVCSGAWSCLTLPYLALPYLALRLPCLCLDAPKSILVLPQYSGSTPVYWQYFHAQYTGSILSRPLPSAET